MVCAAKVSLRGVALASLLALARATPRDVAPPIGRVELHVHLDGAMSVEFLYEVAKSRDLVLPEVGRPRSIADLRKLLLDTKDWHRFDVVNDIIGGDEATITKVGEHFVDFQADSGVVYTEVRYDPVRLARSGYANVSIPVPKAVLALEVGLRNAALRRGVAVHQIHCAMRGQPAAACMEAARLAASMRSDRLGGVVGLDLAGDETDFPNPEYVRCLQHAKDLGLHTTVHAGEATTAEEVWSAMLDMRVDRIGHGYSCYKNKTILQGLKDRRVHVEACPRTAMYDGLLEAVDAYRRSGLSFGLSTDDPSEIFSNGTLADNEALVKQRLNFTDADILAARHHALAAAFAPASAAAAVARANERARLARAGEDAVKDLVI